MNGQNIGIVDVISAHLIGRFLQDWNGRVAVCAIISCEENQSLWIFIQESLQTIYRLEIVMVPGASFQMYIDLSAAIIAWKQSTAIRKTFISVSNVVLMKNNKKITNHHFSELEPSFCSPRIDWHHPKWDLHRTRRNVYDLDRRVSIGGSRECRDPRPIIDHGG